ncbi:DUF6507 family protein [Arthrobacter sp. zg-Y769]|nr:DUF6507 family protein [Arthrobacter sp. zg-Y769]
MSLLQDSENLLAECESAKDNAQQALNAMETALAHCPELADAVDHLRFEVIANDMTDILVRCNNAVHATRESVNAYVEGDRDMADLAHKAASLTASVPEAPGMSGGGHRMVK